MNFKQTLKVTTSSSAMADRPCGCCVLCLRPKSSSCSCRQLLYVRPALHRTCLCSEVGVFQRRWVTFGEYWYQNIKVITLSCGIKISAVHHFVLSQYTHLTDGRTDRQTDRQNCDSNTVRCITCSRTVKTIRISILW